jgi:hypothetical protein
MENVEKALGDAIPSSSAKKTVSDMVNKTLKKQSAQKQQKVTPTSEQVGKEPETKPEPVAAEKTSEPKAAEETTEPKAAEESTESKAAEESTEPKATEASIEPTDANETTLV